MPRSFRLRNIWRTSGGTTITALGRSRSTIRRSTIPSAIFFGFSIPLKPIQTNVPNAGKGELPASYSFYEVKGGAQVSCLKKAEEGDAVVMRLFNPSGNEEAVTVQWCKAIEKAELLDLKEDVKEELAVDGNTVSLTIPANKICTVKFEIAK